MVGTRQKHSHHSTSLHEEERPFKRHHRDGNSSNDSFRSTKVMGMSTSSADDGGGEEYDDANVCSSQPTIEDIHSFFLKDPVTMEERKTVDVELQPTFERILKSIETKGATVAYREYKKQKQQEAALKQAESQNKQAQEYDIDPDSVFRGVPRSYQIKLMQRAAKCNTIVHLGTGMGKTLIAILLIKQMTGVDDPIQQQPNINDIKKKKKVVFLVPSVALVLQHSSTLKANVPLTVGTAFHATVHSEDSRQRLSKSDVLVATHGAYLDLLEHFGDFFSLKECALLVLDECHNCIKNSPYATIMRQFYHTLPKEHRPRVLGLTASPLINIKRSCSTGDLAIRLHELETILDARVVPLKELGLETKDIPNFLAKEAQEEMIWYDLSTCRVPDWIENYCGANRQDLHPCRIKEFRQLQNLYHDLGPHVTALFSRQLQQDLTPNFYEQESQEQYHAAKQYLHRVVEQCQQECRQYPSKRFTHKLNALHKLLDQQLVRRPDAVGLIFCQRRITAMALNGHFHYVRQQQRRAPTGGVDFVAPKEDPPPTPIPKGCQVTGTVISNSVSASTGAQTAPPHPPSRRSASSSFSSQFDDADEDEGISFMNMKEDNYDTLLQGDEEEEDDPSASTDNNHHLQFADADDDPFNVLLQNPRGCGADDHNASSASTVSSVVSPADSDANSDLSVPPITVSIKSSALVRKPSSMFRVMRKGSNPFHVTKNMDQQQLASLWGEADFSIRQVLNGLRRRDINLLIATSIVEEGIDIQACSFVVVFDALTSLKAFIQMKGRARHEDASFFVFEQYNVVDAMSLSAVKEVEGRVNHFLASRNLPTMDTPSTETTEEARNLDEDVATAEQLNQELEALKAGEFRTSNGIVTLRGAKSLLHRYALMQPMDPVVRISRQSLRAHLPSFDFDSNRLSIPAHLGTYQDIRVVSLPEAYLANNKKHREALVSLRACVRLYRHGLLNDRLLPLSEKDIQDRFANVSKSFASKEATVNVLKPAVGIDEDKSACPGDSSFRTSPTTDLYLYPIVLTGDKHHEFLQELNPEGRRLAMLSWVPIRQIPIHEYSTQHFGSVTQELGEGVSVTCSQQEIDIASDFFDLIWNSRWKRRTKDSRFRCRSPGSTYFAYRVVCVDQNAQIDWEHMQELIRESRRSQEERIKLVRGIDTKNPLPRPRLWSPRYDENAVYVTFGPSGYVCSYPFPHEHQDDRIKTYQDYYQHRHECTVPGDSALFDAARQWQLPRRSWAEPHDGIEPLKMVKLPHHAFMEAALANAGMSLLTMILPQFIHHVEMYVMGHKLLEHLDANVPDLGRLLAKIPMEKTLQAITAKSCNGTLGCYEKLEWLGDSVLKLVQTDSLVNSTELGSWIRHLPEGYLNAARSFMGSNRNLTEVCKRLSLDKFIRVESLSRGYWTPESMDLVDANGAPLERAGEKLDGKVCADVVEALLGVVFLEFGYKEAMKATDALQLTIPHKEGELLDSANRDSMVVSGNSSRLQLVAENFTGYRDFQRKSLVEEALTHPTKMSTNTSYSSYQRLEWIGDAVLCLAARTWIYKNLPDLELGDMVVLEATLVCNETLAFLSFQAGLPQFLRHGDQTLPTRIEDYAWSVKEQGRGLWGTDPPKVLADIVEALFGAVHVDGGFEAGQQSCYHALSTILSAVRDATGSELERYSRHPKRNVLSELGFLVSLDQTTEEDLAATAPNLKIWCGDEWATPRLNGSRPVSILKCLGEPVLAVADSVTSSAINRVCTFVSSFLFDHLPVLERFRAIKADVHRSVPVADKKLCSGDEDADNEEDPTE